MPAALLLLTFLLPLTVRHKQSDLQCEADRIAGLDSIKQTASTLTYDLVRHYHGNETGETPGVLDGPPPAGDFYWGEAGAFWITLIEYWRYTGDSSYNDLAKQALLFQKGGNWSDFLPLNYSASMGNDDQGLWASAAMSAAESGFPGPGEGELKWVDLVDSCLQPVR